MDDWMLWFPALVIVGVVVGFHFWMRSIARREIRNELRGWVITHTLQPRNSKGQFRSRHG